MENQPDRLNEIRDHQSNTAMIIFAVVIGVIILIAVAFLLKGKGEKVVPITASGNYTVGQPSGSTQTPDANVCTYPDARISASVRDCQTQNGVVVFYGFSNFGIQSMCIQGLNKTLGDAGVQICDEKGQNCEVIK